MSRYFFWMQGAPCVVLKLGRPGHQAAPAGKSKIVTFDVSFGRDRAMEFSLWRLLGARCYGDGVLISGMLVSQSAPRAI